MAELHIERRGRGTWTWIVAALLLLLVAWVALSNAGTSRQEDDGEVVTPAAAGVPDAAAGAATTSVPTSGIPAEVTGFLGFAADTRPRVAADSTHDYTAAGVRLLAGALQSLSPRDSRSAA